MSVAVATLGLWLSDAAALSLGRISVQSALGEPLRAEIEVPVISAEESASLVVTLAPPSAFSAAGMEYSAVLAGTQISLLKRNDGRSFLRLTSDRPVNDAFMDIILEASWASGRIVRDFTLLLDPPNLRQSNSSAPMSNQLPAVAAAPRTSTVTAGSATSTDVPASVPSAGSTLARNAPPAVAVPPATVASAPAKAATTPPAARETAARPPQVRVKPGDTAGRIAATHKPANVSLDKMLVALLRSNPNAFVDNDLNRIKAGAVLQLPLQDSVDPGQTQRTLLAQSKDFNDYRSKAASQAPQAALAPADRQASGKVQTSVQDDKVGTPSPDKLTLSKGAVQATTNESQLAKERSLQEAADKAAALARNIEELNKLKAAPGASAPAAGASGASAPGADGPAVTSAPARPAANQPVTRPSAPAAVAPDDGLLQSLIGDPAAPIWAVSLMALLAALGVYRYRQRKQVEESDEPSFLASRLKPDSFFAAPPDAEATPADDLATESSLLNPSSLARAAGESDPLAEAEVYLAYGRDAQAEEVLREALRVKPELPGIHQKLLEILAKRRDAVGFEAVAKEVQLMTAGQGPDWQRVRDLGQIIDGANPLYQDQVPPAAPALPTEVAELRPLSSDAPVGETADVDIDLDLDFSLEEAGPAPAGQAEPQMTVISPVMAGESAEPSMGLGEIQTPVEPEIEFDLDLGDLTAEPAPATAAAAAPAPDVEISDLRFDIGDLSLESRPSNAEKPLAADTTDDAPVTNPGALEFDFGSLSLELDTPETAPSEPEVTATDNPLVTKLALADEFAAIGDQEGARALIEEVIAQASGDLQAKAHQALKKL